jgi:hypothetical protein
VPDGTPINETVFQGMVQNLLIDSSGNPIPYYNTNPNPENFTPYKVALGYDDDTDYLQAARDLIKFAAFASSSLEFTEKIIEAEHNLDLPEKNIFVYNFDYMY